MRAFLHRVNPANGHDLCGMSNAAVVDLPTLTHVERDVRAFCRGWPNFKPGHYHVEVYGDHDKVYGTPDVELWLDLEVTQCASSIS